MKGKLHRNVLNQCLPALMSDLDFKPVCMYIQQKGLIDDVTMRDISEERTTSDKTMRLIQQIQQGSQNMYEKFKECLVQAKQENLKEMLEEEEANFAIDQRKESDDLRQLKRQTEDNLNTFRKMGFIPTTQTKDAKNKLQEKRSVVIIGKPGEGKTSTALHLIDSDNYKNHRVVVRSPKQWKKVDTQWVKIVVFEDIFGKYDLDPGRLQEWIDDYLGIIQKHVDVGKLQIIITTRNDILSKANSKLNSFKLFSSSMFLTLTSEILDKSDKKSILKRELQRNKKDLNDDEVEQCIENFSGLIGFPQCCYLFARDKDLFDQGSKFFESPTKSLVDNITNLKADSFVSLVFLFCNGKIEEEFLSPSQIKDLEKYLPVVSDLALYFNITFNESYAVSLRDSYDHFSGLYVNKIFSYEHHSDENVQKSYIQFSHATICEAVGQVLGNKCPEMVVKYGESGYLYQRTYTAEVKDSTSQNTFIPVNVYGLMAERMLHDVVEKGLTESVAQHSALKQPGFLMKLKGELHKSNRIMDFLMANPYSVSRLGYSFPEREFDLSVGRCITFLQCVLQSDKDVVRLVYDYFMEFLECTHNNKSSGCWQCEEKQKLLELALYFEKFEIADKLIAMNACYTHVSLCNAAKHGHLKRVQTILETLKRSKDFNPECFEAKEALYRAFISGNQSLIDLLLKEEITLDSRYLVDVVQDGHVNTLKKVMDHLKSHDNWNPHLEEYRTYQVFSSLMDSGTCRFGFKQHTELLHRIGFGHKYSKQRVFAFPSEVDEVPLFKALCIAYCNEKFDMADYLLKNQVKVSMNVLASVSESGSQQAVDRVIQNLKLTDAWDPQCHDASEALEKAYCAQKFDVCDLLTREKVSLTMKNLPGSTARFQVSFESIKKVIQHLKDTYSWNPKLEDATKALANAYSQKKYDICDLLIKEGVPLTMEHIPRVIKRSLDCVEMAVKLLKDTDSWDAKCDYASKALVNAYHAEKYDVCDLMIREGVLLTMNGLHQVILFGSLESATKAIKQLKDSDSWDPKCVEASEALQFAYHLQKYEVCDLLVHEGVSLTMEHIPIMILRSLDDVKRTMQQLKDAKLWDPKCDNAYKALEYAYCAEKYDVCDLFIHEGVSLTMKGLHKVISKGSLETAKKAIQYLKDSASWDPKCAYASQALKNAYIQQKYELCDLLVQEGVVLTMKNLPGVVGIFMKSVESVMKGIQQLKSTDSWHPNCKAASEALANAYCQEKYDVCDLLIQEGVSLTMKSFPGVVGNFRVSWQAVKKAIKQLKDTDSWDPKCDDASKALENAYKQQKYDVCDLLIQEGVTLTMKHLPDVILRSSNNHVKKALKQLKDTNSWDPECDDASLALATVYSVHRYTICNLLTQEGVSLTMKSLLLVICLGSLESARNSIQQLKDTGCWDPTCDDASKALKKVYKNDKDDVCDLLVKEGVTLTMRHLPAVSVRSLDDVKTVVKKLKDTERWDSKCDDASKALAKAYSCDNCDVHDFLLQEGVTLTMRHLPVVGVRSLDDVKTVVKQLKDNETWDSKCDNASKALAKAYSHNKCDVRDFLLQEGVTLTMKNLPHVLSSLWVPLESVKKAVQHLKDTNMWISSPDYAEKVLAKTKSWDRKNICDFLVNEGVCYPELDK